MAGALAGIRVIDFGQYVAGPAVAMMLADSGAEVIRVDPPGGPRWRSPAARVLNRGKRSIVLDLGSRGDRETAWRLVQGADVVVENFRPGVMARHGLDPTRVREASPGLIYLSLPGFASDDAALREVRGWEGAIAAATGQFTDMGLNRVLMGIDPSFSPLTLASAYAALFGATAVAAALLGRESSGRGDAIEVPVAACLLEGLAYNAMHVADYPQRYKSLRERELERRREAGEPMDLDWQACQSFCDPFYRVYRCADGRFFYPVAGSHATHSPRILDLLGLWDEFKDELAVFDAFLDTAEWPPEPGFTLSNYPCPKPWADCLSARMAEAFATRPAAEWERILGDGRAPGAMVRTTAEWLRSAHARQSGLVAALDDPEVGTLHGMGPLAWFEGEGEVDGRRVPRLDGDREAVLAELEAGPAAPRAAATDDAAGARPWLEGVRVLDFCNVLAGPQIAATLLRFGAEVTALGPVRSSMDPWNTVVYGLQVNQGKRSALADIGSPEGREILDALLARTDVLTFNGPDRQLGPLGLAPGRLHEINPALVLCKLDCYGGPRAGPRSHHPGYDDTTQASTGVMARFGGPDTPEEHAHLGTIDVLSGIAGAFAATVALLERARGGERRYVKTSLAAAGQLIQVPFMYDHAGRAPFDEPSGREVKGEGPFYRCYRAADGWLFFALGDVAPARLSTLPGLEGIGQLAPHEQEARLAATFSREPRAHWQRVMHDLGACAQPMASLSALRERHARDAAEPAAGGTFRFVRHAEHPCGRAVTLVDTAAIRPREAPILRGGPAPKFGAHTREVLRELGRTEAEVERLLEAGVVAESWSKRYLPI